MYSSTFQDYCIQAQWLELLPLQNPLLLWGFFGNTILLNLHILPGLFLIKEIEKSFTYEKLAGAYQCALCFPGAELFSHYLPGISPDGCQDQLSVHLNIQSLQ